MNLSYLPAAILALSACAVSQGGVDPSWRPIPQLALEASGFEMAYDVARERIVMFGGSPGFLDLSVSPAQRVYPENTWEWDGKQWLLKKPAHRPPGREGHAMFYCPVRQKVVLFAGVRHANGSLYLRNDMWEWDGQDWRQLSPPVVPPARSFMAYAVDTSRSRVVLFGGSTGLGSLTTLGDLDDTWEWDGQTWIQQSPQTVPLKKRYASMAFLPKNGRCVMYGGPFYVNGITWEWDGIDWHGHTPALPDPLGGKPYAAHDITTAPDGQSVVFAGQESYTSGPVKTFRWEGRRWLPVTTLNNLGGDWSPLKLTTDIARREMVMYGFERGARTRTMSMQFQDWSKAYESPMPTLGLMSGSAWASAVHDPVREEFVMLDMRVHSVDTWVMRGDEFERLSPSRQPPVRNGYGIVWHERLQRVFLYGGGSRVPGYVGLCQNDTWLWDGVNWIEHISATPPPRGGINDYANPYTGSVRSIAYDSRRDRVVNFIAGETWEWEATAGWQRRQPTVSPPWNRGVLCYDPGRGVTVMAVFQFFPSPRQEIWEYDGATWVQKTPAGFPPPGAPGSMTYVEALGGIVAIDQGTFGGRSVGTWLWDGQTWLLLSTIGQPANGLSETIGVSVYDTTRQALRMLYHRGAVAKPADLVWELRFENLALTETSPRIGQSFDFAINAPSEAGKPWLLALSTDAYPGIPLLPLQVGGVEMVPLAPSTLLTMSLSALMGGVLDSQGRGRFVFPIPIISGLEHMRIHAAAFTLNPATSTFGLITNRVEAEIIR